MGLYPKIQAYDGGMEVVDVFRGLNRAEKISEGEWSEELNLTSDRFPMLSVRRGRKIVERYTDAQVVTLIAKDDLYVLTRIIGSIEDTEDTAVLLKGTTDPVEVARFTYPKRSTLPGNTVSFGAYIVMMDIGAWYNTADGTSGYMGGSWALKNVETESLDYSITIEPQEKTENGFVPLRPRDVFSTVAQGAAKEADENHGYSAGDCYTVLETGTFRRYTGSDWITLENYVKVSAPGIGSVDGSGHAFVAGDSVMLSGFPFRDAWKWNGKATIEERNADYLILKGVYYEYIRMISYDEMTRKGTVPSIGQDIPEMDFVIECQNRLWGCFYGEKDGKLVNEIYASELGDFKSWRNYDGTSMASYAASVGTDGKWTGAVSFQGKPHFFKDKHVHKVYISATGAHQIVDNPLLGVQEGCENSLCVLDGLLYYMSHDGVCAYDGSTPKVISEELGRIGTMYACFGGAENKLWTFFRNADQTGSKELYVYDVKRGIWHRENYSAWLQIQAFARFHDCLYINYSSMLVDLLGNGDGEDDAAVSYSCTSGLIGWQNIEQKYISRFDLRLILPQGATMKVELEYDSSGTWEEQGTVTGGGVGSVVIPVRPRRCDHFRLRLSGTGEMRMYSWAKRLTKGSDVVL